MIKFIPILLELNQYDDYVDFLNRVDYEMESLTKQLRKQYTDVRDPLYKKYMTPEEFDRYSKADVKLASKDTKELTDQEWKDHELQNKIKLSDEDKVKLNAASKRYLNLTYKPAYKYTQNKLNTQPVNNGSSGDLNAKYVYHFTSLQAAYEIVDEGKLDSSFGDNPWMSFTTNKDLLKRGVVFYYSSENYEGKNSKTLPICFTFDLPKLKAKYTKKLKQGDPDKYGTYYGEEEILIVASTIPIEPYIVKVLIERSKIDNKKLLDKFIDKLKENNIKYFFKN